MMLPYLWQRGDLPVPDIVGARIGAMIGASYMNSTAIERRSFLKSAVQALLATPAISALAPFAVSEQAKAPARIGTSKPPAKSTLILNVRNLGAVGDGSTKDTLALQQTIDRVSVLGGGEVLVPAGNYLTGALVLRSNVRLHLEEDATLTGSPDMGDYPLAQIRWEGRWIKGYIGFISAMDAENFSIAGPGKIAGSEAIKGRIQRPSNLRLPALLEFTNCRNVRVEDCTTQQYGMWSIHPTFCSDIIFKNVVVKSGADGIDVDSCQRVVIDGCDFDTGDDCISLKSGRGAEAASQIGINPAITCEDVLITHCSFVDRGFACIGIGSEISGGIRNARIEHCKFNGARSHAIFIKSRVGRGAFVEDISVTDCDVSGMRQGFLSITNLNSGKSDEFNVPGDEGISLFRSFRFTNIRVTDVPRLVEATLHPRKPLDGITLSNITGTCAKGMTLANIKNAHLSGIKVTGYAEPLLAINNVTGTGLTGAGAIDGPKVPDAVPAPETPYKLH
jgi:polygalacturonase